jgi:hypothetical protein
MAGPVTTTLIHGTTRRRALNILVRGPNRFYVEPGGIPGDPAGGFSTFPAGHVPRGDDPDASRYARQKAGNFPDEGGPCLIEVDVPTQMVDHILADDVLGWYFADSGEVRFQPGYGFEELIQAWPRLPKRIVPL